VLQRLVAGRFEVLNSLDEVGTEPVWVDLSDAAESEIAAVVAYFDLSEQVRARLTDARPTTRADTFDGAVACIINVPIQDEPQDGYRKDVTPVSVVITATNAFTAHDGSADDTMIGAALSSGPHMRPPEAALLGLIDEVLERYSALISRLGDRQEAHATHVLDVASGAVSAKSVVAAGLHIAMAIGDIERSLRELRQTVGDLRGSVADLEGSKAAADALDLRLQKLDKLDADLDLMNHRLELMTDAQLNLLSSRQGEINKRIGAWAAVIGVDAVITGWYGMNIEGLPGAGSWVTVAILMASVTLALIVWFRRIDWL
jgi:Mg2+ and Co2+ transporter CorA